jgi:thiamine biosynthesis protein ThiS
MSENIPMLVLVNGETKEIPAELSLTELLEHLSMPSRLLAIELNKEVVRRKDWENIKIRDADVIEVIHFVGGG